MKPHEELLHLYGAPLSMQELTDVVLQYINREEELILGWGLEVSFSERVSNTHHCPRNGQTNWGFAYRQHGFESAPKGYPGWWGRIWIFWKHRKTGKPIDFRYQFNKLGIHPGTGGGGLYNCPFVGLIDVMHDHYYPTSHDVQIFMADWPSLGLVSAIDPVHDNKFGGKRLFYSLSEITHGRKRETNQQSED